MWDKFGEFDSVEELNRAAEAASKQNDLKEVKNINAEEVDQKAISALAYCVVV